MPIINYDLNRTWSWLYRRHVSEQFFSGHPLYGQYIGYSREYAKMMKDYMLDDITWHREYWIALATAASIPTSATIAFIGAGFGWLCEAAVDAGWTWAQAVDDSNWIQAHKSDLAWRWNGAAWVQDELTSTVPIIQSSLNQPISLRNALGGRQDWVITESMLSSLQSPSDPLFDAGSEGDELTQVFDNCETVAKVGGNILHIVFVNARPPFHVRTVAQWKALRPAHLFAPDGLFPGFGVL